MSDPRPVAAAGQLCDDSGGAMFAHALMVTRDRAIAEEAVHDALVIAAGAAPSDLAQRKIWTLAVVRNECLRQLRARTVFIDTSVPIPLRGADPFDAITPGERDALALSAQADLSLTECAQVMGCDEGEARARSQRATSAWSDAAGVLALVSADPTPCPVIEQVVDESGGPDGQLSPVARRRLQRHAGTCERCRPVYLPMRKEATELLDIPSAVPLPPEVRERVLQSAADADTVARLSARLGAVDSRGFPKPLDSDDRDPSRWVRRGAWAAAISAVLLLVGLILYALVGR